MKLKIVLIAALLAMFVIAPAMAATSKTYYAQPMILKDDKSGVQIELNRIVVSDEPLGSISWTYPSSQYDYYQLYYTLYNPTDHEVRYEFNITFVDNKGNVYMTEDNILAYGIAAGRRVPDYVKEFPIPKNATGLSMRWSSINAYLNEREWTTIDLQSEPVATPTPVPPATQTPSATPTTAPTATAKPTPVNGMLPLFALGIVACGLCAVKMYSEHTAKRK